MGRQYNYIYKKLVNSEDDLIGLIAYGIYKKHKIEFIEQIQEEYKREPTDEECSSFFISSTTGKSSVSCPLKPSDSAPLKHSTMPP